MALNKLSLQGTGSTCARVSLLVLKPTRSTSLRTVWRDRDLLPCYQRKGPVQSVSPYPISPSSPWSLLEVCTGKPACVLGHQLQPRANVRADVWLPNYSNAKDESNFKVAVSLWLGLCWPHQDSARNLCGSWSGGQIQLSWCALQGIILASSYSNKPNKKGVQEEQLNCSNVKEVNFLSTCEASLTVWLAILSVMYRIRSTTTSNGQEDDHVVKDKSYQLQDHWVLRSKHYAILQWLSWATTS